MAKSKRLHVVEETAIVFRAPERRYFTRRAAYLAAARHELIKDGCDCEPGDAEPGGGGYPCELHDNGGKELDKRAAVLADQYLQEDRELLRTVGDADDGE